MTLIHGASSIESFIQTDAAVNLVTVVSFGKYKGRIKWESMQRISYRTQESYTGYSNSPFHLYCKKGSSRFERIWIRFFSEQYIGMQH